MRRWIAAAVLGGMLGSGTVFGGWFSEVQWQVDGVEEFSPSRMRSVTTLSNGLHVAVGYEEVDGTKRPRAMGLDDSGDIVWDQAYTNWTGEALYVAERSDGNLFVGCQLASSALFMKIDPADGDLISTVTVSFNKPEAFVLDANDEVVLVGTGGVIRKFDLDGTQLKSGSMVTNDYGTGFAVIQTNDGGYLAGGTAATTPGARGDALLSKFNADLELEWTQRYRAGSDRETIYAVAEGVDGSYAVAGHRGESGASGTGNRWMAFKTDLVGNEIWQHGGVAGNNASRGFEAILPSADGGFVAGGTQLGNFYMVDFDADGEEYRWTRSQDTGALLALSSPSNNSYLAVGYLGGHSDIDHRWAVLKFDVEYDAPPVATGILPFEPTDDFCTVYTRVGETNLFSFTGYDPDGNPLSYRWEFWGGGETVSTSNTYELVVLPEYAGETYSLNLYVSDGRNEIDYRWDIVVEEMYAPRAVIDPQPEPGATGVLIERIPTLSWLIDEDDTHPVDSTSVYFSETEQEVEDRTSGAVVSEGERLLVYQAPGDLEYDTTYYWRVVTHNAVGETASEVWSFTTAAGPQPPSAPVALIPPEWSSGIPVDQIPTLQWGFPCGSATASTVYFSTDDKLVETLNRNALYDDVTQEEGIWSYSADEDLEYETTYFWRVVGENEHGSVTGAVWQFITAAAPQSPSAPYEVSPWNGQTGISILPVFEWGFSGAEESEIYYSTDEALVTGLDPAVRRDAVQSEMDPQHWIYSVEDELELGAVYYWRVVGHNEAGSTTGQVWTFTTETLLDLPYEEGFEGMEMPPEGWKQKMNFESDGGLNGDNLQKWSFWDRMWEPEYIRTGDGAIGCFGGGGLHWLISPMFEAESDTQVRFWIYYGPDEWENDPAPLYLQAHADGAWQTLRTWEPADTNLYDEEIVVDLGTFASKRVRLAWVYDTSDVWGATVAMDDLRIGDGGSGSDPDPVEIGSIVIAPAGQATIRVQSQAGRSYTLQFRESLLFGDWVDVGEAVIGDGEEITLEHDNEAPSGFYRIRTGSELP